MTVGVIFTWKDTGAAETRYYYTRSHDDSTNYTTVRPWHRPRTRQGRTIDTSGSSMPIFQSEAATFSILAKQTTTIELDFYLTDAVSYAVAVMDGAIMRQVFSWGLRNGFWVTVK